MITVFMILVTFSTSVGLFRGDDEMNSAKASLAEIFQIFNDAFVSLFVSER
jgi:hypothetical protein